MSATDELRTRLITLPDQVQVSATRQIEQMLPEIEAALKRGVPRETVRKTLWEAGIKVEPSGFASALHRSRKKSRTAKTAPSVPSAQAAPSVALPDTTRALREIVRNKPDLQKWTDLAKKGEQK
jgi:hypothetical protein